MRFVFESNGKMGRTAHAHMQARRASAVQSQPSRCKERRRCPPHKQIKMAAFPKGPNGSAWRVSVAFRVIRTIDYVNSPAPSSCPLPVTIGLAFPCILYLSSQSEAIQQR
jgi:hypothetical protein